MYVGMEAPKDAENWEQDPDVLDTWFSSALWPFSTLGWPNEDSDDFKRYFPTNTLVTGYDIIFFWVSRMIFQSLTFTGKRPFKHVLIHGLMRDAQGRKMSKSLGNGIDPMDVIDKYGVDSLRWFLSTGNTAGQDVRFSYDKIESAWNFINKIWNASRYVIMNLGDMKTPKLPDKSEWNLADRWILSKLNKTTKQVTEHFDKFNFGEAGRAMYDFIWNDFCDWYIEMSKETLTGEDQKAKDNTRNVLAYVLDKILKLMHPIMPFVTEKIWLSMPHEGKSLVVAKYPETNSEFDDDKSEKEMSNLIELIKVVRNIRAKANAPMSSSVDILIKTENEELKAMFENNKHYIDRFCHPKDLQIGSDIATPKLAMTGIITDAEINIPLAELVDLNDEITKIQKDIDNYTFEVERAEKKLSNKKFVNNAPEQVVNAEKEKQLDNQSKLNAAKQRLADIKSQQ